MAKKKRNKKKTVKKKEEEKLVEPTHHEPAHIVGGAIIALARAMKGGSRAPIPLAITPASSDGIPLQCDGKYDAFAEAEGEEEETDFPGGDGPGAVRAAAVAKAKEEAETDVNKALDAISARIECESGCSVTEDGNRVITFGTPRVTPFNIGYWVTWNAKITATGKVTFKCQ